MDSPSVPPGATRSGSPRAGDVLAGKFRVERVLGEGGMGVVVAATNLALGQLVALKFMLPAALANPDNLARFEREARAAVRLKSEHVARVSDVGRLEDGTTYMVMEYLEGEDLADVLERQGPLPVEVAVDYLLQVCEAIAEAHSLGIVHRDLKPRNLFLTRRTSGRPLVKVLDFGISKVADPLQDMTLTGTTQVLGSPLYMAPEQFRSARDADPRSDVWALGVILYQLLTDRAPFVADTITQLTAMVIQDTPRPIEDLRGDVPASISAAIAKCMEKYREDRFQSVPDLVRAIAKHASPAGVALAREILETRAPEAGPVDSSVIRVGVNLPTKTLGLDQTEQSTATSIIVNAPPKRPPYGVLAVVFGLLGAAAAVVVALNRPAATSGLAMPTPPTATEPVLVAPSSPAPMPSVTGEPVPSIAASTEAVPRPSASAPLPPKTGPRTTPRTEASATARVTPTATAVAPTPTAAPPPPPTTKPNDLPSTRD